MTKFSFRIIGGIVTKKDIIVVWGEKNVTQLFLHPDKKAEKN